VVVDPGGTTGWATVHPQARLVRAGQFAGNEWEQVDAVLRLWLAQRTAAGLPALVVEAFSLRVGLNEGAKSRAETLSPVRLTFALEYTIYRLAVRGVVPPRWGSTGAVDTRQQANDAKHFATDERLRRWGLYVPGDHARDAVRHACLWLTWGGREHDQQATFTTGSWSAERVR
jgi:hypothetical protein